MSLLSLPAIMMASIVCYVGVYHFLIFLRRPQNKVDLTFAFTCVAVSIYDLFCAGLYGVSSVEEGVFWQRLQIIGLGLSSIALLWFVAQYTSQKSKKAPIIFSILYFLLVFIAAFERKGLIWTDVQLVKEIQLPFGIEFSYYEMAPGPITNIFSLLGLIVYVYICWSGIRLYLRGDKRKAIPLLFSMLIFFLGVFNDAAIASGVYSSIYLMEYSFLALVLLMAYSLSTELVASNKIRMALKESEKRFRSLVANAADGLFLYDDKGKIIDVNRRVTETTGFSRTELLSMSAEEVKIQFDLRDIVNHNMQNKLSEKHITLEGVHIRKDGSIFPVEVRFSKIYMRNQNLTLALARDITERKKTEAKLLESEKKYRDLANSLPQVIFEMNTDGRITFVNSNAFELFGYTHEDFDRGLSTFQMLDAKDQDSAIENLQRRINGEKVSRREYTAVRKDGTQFPVIIHVNPVFQGESVIGFRGILIDITDQKQIEEARAASEKRYRTLFEKSIDAIFIIDKKSGKYIDANEAALKLTGRTLSELKQLTTQEITPLGADERLKKIKESKSTESLGKITYERPDGSKRVATLNSVPLSDDLAIGIARDITEELEKEILLRQAQKMESIGTLAGGIAHDFNNILSAIIGYTEISLDNLQKDTEIYNNLHEILRAGKRATDLIKHILTFSRQAEIERKPVQISLIVKETLKFLRSSLPTTIDIQQNILSDSLILADPTQVHQILMNLCTNAGHAMRDKGGILNVRLEDINLDSKFTERHLNMKPGPYLKLTVSDTGHGIPQEVIERIFDPFFTTKKVGEGTGMGLSAVHGIVGSYGGTVTVQSKPKQGSSFIIYLPVVNALNETEILEGTLIPTGKERILLIDDEVVLAEAGKKTLESLGYDVDIRTSSIEALELFKLKADSFDLVITDMTMPNMTGDELATELLGIKSDIPVIICTGYSTRINQEQANALGISAFVSKPVLKKDIAKTIRKVLET